MYTIDIIIVHGSQHYPLKSTAFAGTICKRDQREYEGKGEA
jgi:hypothetical protein